MSIKSDDKLQNGSIDIEDSCDKVNIDVLLLIDRLKIIKNKIRNTPWYRIWTLIKLRKELSCIERESDEIGERLVMLYAKDRNPMQIVKRT